MWVKYWENEHQTTQCNRFQEWDTILLPNWCFDKFYTNCVIKDADGYSYP